MVKLLARFLRGIAAKLASEPAPTPAAKPTNPLSWARAGLGREPTGFDPMPGGVRVEYALPEDLPGVRPAKHAPEEVTTGDGGVVLAMDGGYKEQLATDGEPVSWSGLSGGGAIGPGLAFLGFPYLAELQQITEYRTPCESLATEMTRRWGKLKNTGKTDLTQKIKEITQCIDDMKVRDVFRWAAYITESFGRAHLYISVKDQDDDRTRQLPLTEIKKGELIGFRTIEPYWVTPYTWNATHPERPDFYKPSSWYVLGRKTNATRMLTFIFREVPDLLKPAYSFSGISMTQLMMPYVNRWLRTAKNVNDLINIFSIVTLSTDLATMLQQPIESPKSLLGRVRAFTQTRDNRGMMVINKGTEELTTQNVPLGSLDKLQAQAQEHMATPSRMTLIKQFGITPTGLNATAEPELQVSNDYVHAMQESGFTRHMQLVLKLIQMHLYGAVEKDLAWEWLNLYEPSGKEKAEIRKADTDRDTALIEKNVVSPDEVRNRLRLDPESGYDGLEGDAPEPQEWSGGMGDDPENPEVKTGEEDDKPPKAKGGDE
jgi:phage-related protein (TIGR01555 family)